MNNTAKVSFNEAHERIIENIQRSKSTLLLGRAGTGKSNLIRKVKEKYPAAFHGIATKNGEENG